MSKTIELRIKNHHDRLDMLSALKDNGYKAWIAKNNDKVYVMIVVDDSEVLDRE